MKNAKNSHQNPPQQKIPRLGTDFDFDSGISLSGGGLSRDSLHRGDLTPPNAARPGCSKSNPKLDHHQGRAIFGVHFLCLGNGLKRRDGDRVYFSKSRKKSSPPLRHLRLFSGPLFRGHFYSLPIFSASGA